MDLRGPLEALADELTAAGVDATLDPGKVRLPGVLVRLRTVDPELLAGHAIGAEVLCIAPDRDDPRSLDTLGELLDKVLAVAPATGPATAASIQLPAHPSPMPGLTVPVALYT